MRRVSVFFLNFTGFWLVVTIIAFAMGHWGAAVIALVIAAGGAAGFGYRWRNPSP